MTASSLVHDNRPLRLAASMGVSGAVALAVAASAWMVETRLSAPLYWPWVLTGLQVVALWAAGRHHWWGWLLGATVQPPWIVYAILTQLGFIPGCAVSALVQTGSFVHGTAASRSRAAPPGACMSGEPGTVMLTARSDTAWPFVRKLMILRCTDALRQRAGAPEATVVAPTSR